LIIALVVVGVAVLLLVGFVAVPAIRRRRAPEERAPVIAPERPPPEAPPRPAPPAEAPPVEVPEVMTPPVVEAPPEGPVEVAPPPEVPVAPPRRRVRSIGTSLARLFRGTSMTAEDWEELEEVLLRADVGVAATGRIVGDLRARKDTNDGLAALRTELLSVLGSVDRSMNRRGDGLTVWLVTGVNGVGKTTTIGKLAAQLRDGGSAVVLAAADTFRAAADTQLERWAEIAGAQIVKHAPGADPAAVVYDGVAAARARGADVLIVDTAGRLQTKKNLMEELGKIRRVLEREAGPPDEVLLVLDATTGQNGIQQARAFAEVVSVTGIALTKLDGTAKGGIVVAVQQELGIPVKLVGIGEGVGDLAPFEPADFVDDLLAV
jgi:fused signal recognition particle receptor